MAGSGFWRRRAPIWLRILLGLLIVPVVWAALMLALSTILPSINQPAVVVTLLVAGAVIGGVVSWVIVRRASTRVAAAFATLALLAYGFLLLAAIPSYQGYIPRKQADTEAPAEEAQAPPWEDSSREGAMNSGSSGSGGVAGAFPPLMPELPMPSQDLQIPPQLPQALPKPPDSSPAPSESYERATPTPAELLPEFPWPPPKASASYVLPNSLFAQDQTVGAVVDAILKALEQGGYVERSFFRTPPGGVALVTRLERINDDGSPFSETQRWPGGDEHIESTATLYAFLRGLFYVDPGHYRVIVFVLQDLPFTQSSTRITAQQAQAWLMSGANVLPPDIAERPFGGGHCTVLVYEFASDGTNVHVVESSLTGKDHLEKAGVLSALDYPQ